MNSEGIRSGPNKQKQPSVLLFPMFRVTPVLRRRGYATAVAAGGASDSAAYCRALVQKHDYDSFLASYFYPRSLQPGYLAIRAFNVCMSLPLFAFSANKYTRVDSEYTCWLGGTGYGQRAGFEHYHWENENAVLARHNQVYLCCTSAFLMNVFAFISLNA